MNLTEDSLYVWHVPLAAVRAQIDHLNGFLSLDEIAWANQFATAPLRDVFVLARSSFRILIGKAVGMPPEEIRFIYGPYGKPAINGVALRFNLSHSGDWAAVALAWSCEVGVDIERIRPIPELEEIARAHFSAAEASELLSIPAEKRITEFYRCWTRRESRLKAIGVGLSGANGQPGTWTDTRSSSHAAESPIPCPEDLFLNLLFLESPQDYVTALAYSGARRNVYQVQLNTATDLLNIQSVWNSSESEASSRRRGLARMSWRRMHA